MKEFVISEAQVETAILVGLITQTQDERKTKEYLDELAVLGRNGWSNSGEKVYSETAGCQFRDLCR